MIRKTKLIKGVSHTTPEGHDFAIKVMNHLREATDKWKKERDEYEALLDEYELVITELEAKIAATNSNEYKQRLTNVKSYRRKLFSLAN